MQNYEYKSIIVKGKFRESGDVNNIDKSINESAANGWELVTATALANNMWDHGKTNGILLTFKRAIEV